ncbi:DUF4097 family beta strand repeat-containing protein [Streptomyces violascens]|uniref:DUF4097 domain-containing protein n=1 Tax=Streptomyces violascens TaxID=67381 RepID=A0ABQ3QKY4_9ACTN|nr:DUF4097 family beta strand repeat-containing protein [Streptomyces violascens]GGU45440.1 hypothetical protein GCM10010289_77410 [Streptomyces violascens]GHI37933.1 hypothetical protein Sviol_23410 [Streptomyces violascens]
MSATEQREAPKTARAPQQRPRHRAAWIVVAVIGALGIVAPFTISLMADTVSRTDPYESPDNGRPHAVSAVEVDAGAAEITVTTGAAGQVTMDGKLTWAMKRPKIERTWDGDTLKVHARCDGFVDEFLQNCQVKLDLAVPAGVRLKVKTGSGPVKVRDLTGPVDLDGGSGSLKLYGLKGTVRAKVGSGTVQASQLSSPEADLKSGSGSVDAQFAAAPQRVKASTGSGSVSVTVPEGAHYQVMGGKGSGSRDIQPELADKNSDRVLDVSSGSGSVTVGYPGS